MVCLDHIFQKRFMNIKKTEALLTPISILIFGVIVSLSLYYAPRMSTNKVNRTSNENVDASCSGDNRLSEDCMKKYAEELELDTDQFAACLEDEKYDDTVSKEFDYGVSVGVAGTPTIFLVKKDNDKLQGFQIGAVTTDNLRDLVDRLKDDNLDSVQKYWEGIQFAGFDDLEVQVREYYAGPDGGALEGDELDKTVKTYMDNQEKDLKATLAVVDLDFGDGQVKGSSDIYLMEFSDYECPYCHEFATGELKKIKEEFSEDELSFVFRDFPLDSIHPKARGAANAARCAGEQGKYFEYHDKLFAV